MHEELELRILKVLVRVRDFSSDYCVNRYYEVLLFYGYLLFAT